MAIAFDAATSGGTQSSTGPLNFNHTCTGTNGLLFVNAFGGDGADVVTGITYNSVAMTFIAKVLGGVNHYSYLYYLINPATGTNQVSISYSGNHFMSGGAASYTGCDQSSQPDASTTNTGNGTTLSTSLTSIADQCWFILIGANNVGANSAGTGSTARTNTSISWDIFDSNSAQSPGSYSMAFTPTSSSQLSAIMASFDPPSTTSIKTKKGLAKASVKTAKGLAIASVKTMKGLA